MTNKKIKEIEIKNKSHKKIKKSKTDKKQKSKITKIKTKKTRLYDNVIIGGGISGLYSAYKLLNKNPKAKILILEKNPKNELGGRMKKDIFENTLVNTGAGIGRLKKDIVLKKLMDDLKLKYSIFTSKHQYSTSIGKCNLQKQINILRSKYKTFKQQKKSKKQNKQNKITFKEYAIKILGSSSYDEFKTCLGYTDYENSDIRDVLENYGLKDNYTTYKGLGINWNNLRDKLVDFIKTKNIRVNCNVYKLRYDKKNNIYKVYYKKDTNTKNFFICSKQVIIASTIDTVKKLLPNYKLYNDIKTNSFLRIYAKFNDETNNIIQKYVKNITIVKGFLQKIIPIDPIKGIYMIAYSDNKNADHLHKVIQKYNNKKTKDNKLELYKYFEKLLIKSLGIIKNKLTITNLKEYYWKIGTHYYTPLNNQFKTRQEFINKAQNPAKNLFVVGECIALDQGWCNGALTSVNNVI